MSSEAPTELIPLTAPAPGAPDRPPRRRRVLLAAAVAVAVLGAAGAAFVLRPGRPAADATTTSAPAVKFAELTRADLSTSQSLSGTLGFGTARKVTGGGAGIVTWMPQPGAVVKRGQQLYRVDDRPVALFYGGMPLFRTLSERNTVGRDVRIVADNLRALGYSIGRQPSAGERVAQVAPAAAGPSPSAAPTQPSTTVTVRVRTGEGVLTTALVAAIRRWQRDERLPETGTLAPTDVVVQVAAVRVDSVAVQPGAGAEGDLMSVTPTAKVITVLADVAESSGIDTGDKVSVELPGGDPAPGRVIAVGTELRTAEGGAGDGPPRRTISVTVNDPKRLKGIDSADVGVSFAGATRKNVLVAPVTALLALSEGGYAVQLEDRRLVAVETGMFAKGMVEVEGAGLAEGTRVVTTS